MNLPKLKLSMACLGFLIFLFSPAFTYAQTYQGVDYCLNCHDGSPKPDKSSYMTTAHPHKIQGPPTDSETPVLTTMINGSEVSIFDPCTEGYSTYIEPWADYFNEPNVVYTVGGFGWKQRFLTRLYPTSVVGSNYTGYSFYPGNDFVVMGAMWNKREEKWQDYHGPTGANNWYTEGRQFKKKCGGCHTTGFDPSTGSWADQGRSGMQKGVTCESCHGPDFASMIHPIDDLTYTQQIELCGSCHNRGSSIAADGVSPGPYGYPYSDLLNRNYQPGDDLDDFYVTSSSAGNFWPNGPLGTNGNSKKHHQQFLDLKLSSHLNYNVGCIECHEPHDTTNPHQLRLPGNDMCTTSCHTDKADPADYRLHSAHDPGTALCMDCHMPYTAKTINAFDIRSHTTLVIPPAETIAEGALPEGFSGALDTSHIPNSCNSSCHNGIGPGPLKTNAIAQLGLNYVRTLNGSDNLLKGDFNGDGIVNIADWAFFTNDWLKTASWFKGN